MKKGKILLSSLCIGALSISLINVTDATELRFKQAKTEKGVLREEFLAYIVDIFKTDVFIETGTYAGETTAVAHQLNAFKEIHTIELGQKMYEAACNRFKDIENIYCHHGSSAEKLKEILP